MSTLLEPLKSQTRVLFAIPLKPIQGSRFQPTGFPSLGAATFRSHDGDALLVESAQSMANRLELTIWDDAKNDVVEALSGISHIKVTQKGAFLTDTLLEAHRVNSPYILENPDKKFLETLKTELGGLEMGPVNRKRLAEVLLKYDVGSLLHGVFIAKKDLAGGRLRTARALSAFIEANDIQVAASGGVKNDHVNPSGDTAKGFGNVPFARDEYTAKSITLYVNLDLAQLRGYGLGEDAVGLLTLMALYKLRTLVNGNLRLRTACDLAVATDSIVATLPKGFALPAAEALAADVKLLVGKLKDKMVVTTVAYEAKLEKAKQKKEQAEGDEAQADDAEEQE